MTEETCGTFWSEAAGRKLIEYDYRDADGTVFRTVGRTLAECRAERDKWLVKQKAAHDAPASA